MAATGVFAKRSKSAFCSRLLTTVAAITRRLSCLLIRRNGQHSISRLLEKTTTSQPISHDLAVWCQKSRPAPLDSAGGTGSIHCLQSRGICQARNDLMGRQVYCAPGRQPRDSEPLADSSPSMGRLPVTLAQSRGMDRKTVVLDGKDEFGNAIKITRVIALKKISYQVTEAVKIRMSWEKFGKASGQGKGPDLTTTIIGEEVFLHLSKNLDLEAEKKEVKPSERKLTCRNCAGEHWTSKCPFKDTLAGGEEVIEEKLENAGRYQAPALRYGRLGGLSEEQFTVRISNLSEHTSEQDLAALSNSDTRHAVRMFLGREGYQGICKGYAFVSYATKKEAQSAIEELNGHGFGNLILRCEFAAERKP